MPAKKVFIPLLIFIVAYVFRLAYIIEISDRPYFTAPAVDAEYHDQWAMDIADGEILRDEPFFRAPLYPFFLGSIYALFGHDYFAARVVQALVGSLTAVLVYMLGKRLFSRRVGTIAGLTAASTGIIVYFEGELLIPVLLMPLDLGLIIMLLKAIDEDGGTHWWASGLLFGLSAIARPNIVIIAPLLVYLFLMDKDLRRGLIRMGFFALGLILPLAPVAYHNIHSGEFVLIATQGGVNFYIGNNPESNGATSEFPGLGTIWRYEDAVVEAETEAGKTLSAAEVSGFFYEKGLRFAAGQPFSWLKLTGKKILLFMNGIEISNNKNIYFAAKDSFVLGSLMNIGFWLYGPLGILGLALFYGRNFQGRIIAWFVILYSASVVMFFITARYRMPLVPILIIYAVGAVDWLVVEIRTGSIKQLIAPIAVLAGLMALVNMNFYGLQKIAPDYAHYSLGNAYHKKGKLELAKGEYLKALTANPHYLQVHLNLGVIYYEQGDYTAAEREFRRELEINHGLEAAFAYNNLGNIRLQLGDLEEALAYYRKALEIYSNYKDGRINLGRTYSDLGMLKVSQDSLELAKEYFAKAVELLDQEPMYRYNYGLILGELGYEGEAVAQMEEALKIDPNFEPALRVLETYRMTKFNSDTLKD